MSTHPQLIHISPAALRTFIREAVVQALSAPTIKTIPQDDDALIDLEAVKVWTGLGKTAIYERVPGRCSLGPRCARWRAGDVRAWLRQQANSSEQ